MKIDQLIKKLEYIQTQYGKDVIIDGWGDEGGSIGIYALEKRGECETAELDTQAAKQEMYKKFKANRAFHYASGKTKFYAPIADKKARIEL